MFKMTSFSHAAASVSFQQSVVDELIEYWRKQTPGSYTSKPPPLAAEPNIFLQAENRRKNYGSAEKPPRFIFRLAAAKISVFKPAL